MLRKTKPTREYAKYLIRCILPRCWKCDQLLLATCDRSKPSELTEFKGIEWTKKNPQIMMLYPTAKEQSKLCPYCEDRLYPTKVGKES